MSEVLKKECFDQNFEENEPIGIKVPQYDIKEEIDIRQTLEELTPGCCVIS